MQVSVETYPRAAVERAMKVQEVLRAMAKKITYGGKLGRDRRHERSSDAALRWRYENYGYDGLLDRRRGRPSERRVPLALAVLGAGTLSGKVLRPERAPFPESWGSSTASR